MSWAARLSAAWKLLSCYIKFVCYFHTTQRSKNKKTEMKQKTKTEPKCIAGQWRSSSLKKIQSENCIKINEFEIENTWTSSGRNKSQNMRLDLNKTWWWWNSKVNLKSIAIITCQVVRCQHAIHSIDCCYSMSLTTSFAVFVPTLLSVCNFVSFRLNW